MDIYVHILRQMGFRVSEKSYFLVCNAEKTSERFDAKLYFSLTLIDYKTDTSWISKQINEMKTTLDSSTTPEKNPYCENCAYIEQGGKLIDE